MLAQQPPRQADYFWERLPGMLTDASLPPALTCAALSLVLQVSALRRLLGWFLCAVIACGLALLLADAWMLTSSELLNGSVSRRYNL